ncbi:MAG: Stp1/IreP family PP2C-type Ser/Thr phosphatase, partial [Chloroflexota bacterium]
TKDLETLRKRSGEIEQFIINILQEPHTSFEELGQKFAQLVRTPEPGATIPFAQLARGAKTRRLPLTKLTSWVLSDVGKVREHNEDHYLAQPFDAANGFFVVADGMGGHASGEDASKIAIDVMYASAIAQWTDVKTAQAPEGVREFLGAWIKHVNDNIFATSQARNDPMGTTLTAALVLNGEVYVVNVGDSRTYLFRNGQLYPLTHDHSLVASFAQAGIIKPEDVYTHPQRNEILRAVGLQAQVNADIFNPVPLQADDRLVLCSDGLWEMVRPAQFTEILRRNSEPQKACIALVSAANRNGGEDNITVIVVKVGLE